MKNILWDGKPNTLKEVFPHKAGHAVMIDKTNNNLVIIPYEGETFSVKVGEYFIRNNEGTITKMIELQTPETLST